MTVEIRDKNLYYVGGVVRDEILGVLSFDTDFCYEGNAIEFAKRKGFEIIKENLAFGTVRVVIDGEEVDIASTRMESYPKKGHLPIVGNIGCALRDDLARRDFTINALAKNTVTGEIIDYFDGIKDLKSKKIRVLHNNSFIDDPTRILRALKFAVRFDFELDEYTQNLQDEYLNNINYDVCFHRLKKELKDTFNLNSELAYEKFIRQKIYKLINPVSSVLLPNYSIKELVEEFNPENIWLIYLGIFDLSNFELTKTEANIISSYNSIKNNRPKSDFEIYKMFENVPKEAVLLYAAYVNSEVALKYLRELSLLKIEISGLDLKNMGYLQGKIYKEIFDYLIEQKISGNLLNKEDEIKAIKDRFRCC